MRIIMSESAKTLIFTTVAIALACGAFANYRLNQPTDDAKYSLVGKPFFEDYESSSDAVELEVVTIDPDNLSPIRLSVKNDKGTWRIPSHHNYPAEAADRLAETATSAMGITRISLEGTASDFGRLGVIDPLEMDAVKTDDSTQIGNRFTLRDANGEPLVDLIIGKPAGEVPRSAAAGNIQSKPATYYYVRRPDEQMVYKALININLSTKFSDWIDPDLLRVDPGKVVRLNVDNYELKEQTSGFLGQVRALVKEQGDKVLLSRKSFTDAWELAGLNAEKDQINLGRVQSTLEILSQLTIAGVRPKFKYKDHLLLTPDLKFNVVPEMEKNVEETQAALAQFQEELEDRGFNFAGTQEKLMIASANGELQVGTDDGVLYTLHIGRTIEGNEKEIEIGGAKSVDDIDTAEEKEKIANYQEGEKSRYLMVRVSFDESLLGARPTKPIAPVEPTKPDGYTPPEKTESKSPDNLTSADETGQSPKETDAEKTKELAEGEKQDGEKQDGENQDGEKQDGEKQDGEKQDDSTEKKAEPTRDPAFDAYDAAMAVYEQQKIEFELGSTRFEEELKEFEDKIVEGKKLVDELNERFGDWYYVIRGSNLRTLKLVRADVTQPRADLKPEAPPTVPAPPNFSQPPTGDQPELKFEPGNVPPEKAEPELPEKDQVDAKVAVKETENDTTQDKKKPEGKEEPETQKSEVDGGKREEAKETETEAKEGAGTGGNKTGAHSVLDKRAFDRLSRQILRRTC
jgi:hypothetical protein